MDQEPTRRAGEDAVPPPAEPGASDDAAARAVMGRMVARHGAPSLIDYRRTYDAAGLPWPGDDVIRDRHPVADEHAGAAHHSAA